MEAKVWYESLVSKLNCTYSQNESEALAKYILKEIVGITIIDIIANKFFKIVASQVVEIDSVLNRLKNEEPVQYILGKADFLGKSFFVNSHVLIPRPETEELVLLVTKEWEEKQQVSVLDLGTGSGCISIGVKSILQESSVYGVDISYEALLVARKNAERMNLEVIFLQEDIFNPKALEGKIFDVIISNPPYIPESERYFMQKNVKDFEPSLALFVPDAQPLLFYEAIVRNYLVYLSEKGAIYFEIHHLMGNIMLELFNKHSMNAIVYKDFHGKDRFVKGVKKQ